MLTTIAPTANSTEDIMGTPCTPSSQPRFCQSSTISHCDKTIFGGAAFLKRRTMSAAGAFTIFLLSPLGADSFCQYSSIQRPFINRFSAGVSGRRSEDTIALSYKRIARQELPYGDDNNFDGSDDVIDPSSLYEAWIHAVTEQHSHHREHHDPRFSSAAYQQFSQSNVEDDGLVTSPFPLEELEEPPPASIMADGYKAYDTPLIFSRDEQNGTWMSTPNGKLLP